MIAGYAAFVPGLAIVYFHNKWTSGWPVLVTVIGWLSLVVGLLRTHSSPQWRRKSLRLQQASFLSSRSYSC